MINLRSSFKHALNGIKYCWLHENNFKIHVIVACWSMVMGLMLSISTIEWILIVSSISLVLICEMINTSFEALNDLTDKKINKYSKTSKDVAAGAVLVSSIYSFIIGIIIFLPKIILIMRTIID